MNTKTTLVYVFFSIFILGIYARGEAPDRRWSISAGAKTRRVEYSFDSRGLDNWQDYITPLQSRGSLNLYSGNGRTVYEDGSIGPVLFANLPGIGASDNFPDTHYDPGYRVAVYHSTGYSEQSYSVTTDRAADNKEVVAPFLKARRNIAVTQWGNLGFSVLADFCNQSSERSVSVRQTVTQQRTVYEFQYEARMDAGGDGGYIVYDPEAARNSNDDWIIDGFDLDSNYPQRNVTSQDTVTTGILNGLMDAEVDIYWYELTLGLDWTQTLFERLDLYALVGPTMHVLDWEMEHNTTWTLAGENSPVTTTHANDSGTKTLAGGVAELGINLYLDSGRRYFIEASGEYLYLEDVTLHAGAASVEVDPESWGGKLGIGMFL